MKKLTGIVLVLTLMFALFAGCGGSDSPSGNSADTPADSGGASGDAGGSDAPAPDKVYEIKLVTSNPSTDPTVELFYKYADEVRRLTGGGVDIQVYPGGEILMGDEGIEAIMSDAAVITFNDLDVLADYVPEFSALCAAYLYEDYKTIEVLHQQPVYQEIIGKANDANVHVITAAFCVGSRSVLASGVELYSVEDCSGLNIRIPNVTQFVRTFDAFGANYSAIGWGDGVTACETGLLNGAEGTSQRMVTSGLYEILSDPVFSCIKYRMPPTGLEVGYGYWMTLPEEYRDIITEQFTLCALESNAILFAEEDDYTQQLRDLGVKVIDYEDIDIESFRTAAETYSTTMPMYDEVAAMVRELEGR